MARVLSIDQLADEYSSSDDFLEVVGRLEHEQLDFKVRPDGLGDVMPAMSMTDGGLIVLGISDRAREIRGCPLNQAAQDRIMDAAHSVGLDVLLREVTVGGVSITVVAVPEVRNRIVTTTDGRLLRRNGSSNRPLVGDALGRFVRDRDQRSAEEEPVGVPALDEIELDLVNHVLTEDGRGRVRREGLTRALTDLGVAHREPAPTGTVLLKAAVILFARDPRRFIPGAAVQVVRRAGVGPGPGPTTARAELSGPVPRLIEDAMRFIEQHTGQISVVIGARREAIPVYPTAAVRETLLNALAHRDYGISGTTVDVTIWDDRLEIQSPGGLPGHITVDNIREEHYSRNRRVMGVLKTLRFVEEYGEGMDRIFGELEARLMSPPLITDTAASVTVTLYARSLLSPEDQAWLALLGHLPVTPPERRALVLARREGSVTPRRLRTVLPGEDVDALLAAAVAKGLLTMTGERGGARYVLSDEIVMRSGASGLEARGRQRQRLLDEIVRQGSLSTVEAAELLGEGLLLARHLLNDLARAGQVVARGRTRARRYYLPELALAEERQ